jgi:hypothetical protein
MLPQIIEPFCFTGNVPNVDEAIKYLKSQLKGYWMLAPLATRFISPCMLSQLYRNSIGE